MEKDLILIALLDEDLFFPKIKYFILLMENI